MSLHPLIALVSDRDVKQAKGFRAAAERLTGASLEADYQTEVANAPKRSAEGLAHLGVRVGRKAKGRQHGRDEKHLAEAIARAARSSDEEAHGTQSLELPTGESITLIDSAVPIKTAAPDKEKGASDPNAGIEDLPLLALIGDDRVAVSGAWTAENTYTTKLWFNETPYALTLQMKFSEDGHVMVQGQYNVAFGGKKVMELKGQAK